MNKQNPITTTNPEKLIHIVQERKKENFKLYAKPKRESKPLKKFRTKQKTELRSYKTARTEKK